MSKPKVSREEKMSMIQEKLETGVREIFESENYKDYIRTIAKFPNYSINNCILIASQRPDASCVCGYKTWQTEFNRTVNRNESGIMIIAPVKYKADVDEPIYDGDSHPVIGDDGKQKTEKVTKEFKAFRPAYVFDVQQTSGDPLPSLVHLLQGGVQDYEAIKSALIEISPVSVAFEPIGGGANGFYSPGEKRIVVKEDLPELQTIKTLIHEIAHAELGHGSEEDKFDRKTKEVQAESVAYWVAAMLGTDGSDDQGLDTSDYSFGYISGWSKDKEVTELKESLDLIKETADRISMNLEKALAKTQTKQEAENHDGESEEVTTKIRRKKVR